MASARIRRSYTLGLFVVIAACGVTDGSQFDPQAQTGNKSGAGGGDGLFGDGSDTGDGVSVVTDPPCDNSEEMDGDGDGWTGAQGDCNDCTALMNPGAYDYPGNTIDEDCNGTPDDEVTDCDASLGLASNDAMDGARAMGICRKAEGESWGVIEASYINVDGSAPPAGSKFHMGHGILDTFGNVVKPQSGAKLFAISSGTARAPGQPGYERPGNPKYDAENPFAFPPEDPGGFDKDHRSAASPGFPIASPSCPDVAPSGGKVFDSVALRLRIKAPTNARSVAFNVNMYTYEFPQFICTPYNDFVTVMLSAPGAPAANISFDSQGNPLSVNAGFLEVCRGQEAGGKDFPCALGPAALAGTGFEERAATGWLETTATVEPGSTITLEFGVWDTLDPWLDSTALFDNLHWGLDETPTQTAPVDVPK